MSWWSLFAGNKNASMVVHASGKAISVLCTRRASKALAQRDQPLIMEIELAFACFARKQVHFHEATDRKDLLQVHDRLSLLITTVVAQACNASSAKDVVTTTALRTFMPKSVRVDYTNGKWIGEYSL